MLKYTPIAQFAIGIDHRVKVWNKAFEVLTGVCAEEIIDTDYQWKIFYSSKRPVLADLVVEQDYEKFLEIYGTKNPAQSSIVSNAWEATDYFENINGKPRYINFLAAPVFDHEGNITGAVTTLQDITLRKTQEDAIKRESEQLQQQYSLFQSSMGKRVTFCNIIGKSRKMSEVIAVSDLAADLPLTNAVARFEKQFILSALDHSRWHRGKAAKKMGISRKTLYRKMVAHGIDLP